MGGAVTLAVPVLDTAVGVRIPTTGLGGTVQIVAAVNYGSLGGSDTVVTTGITDWPADQHYYLSSHQSESDVLPLATVSVFLEVAAVWKINDEAELSVSLCLSVFYRSRHQTSPGCRSRRQDTGNVPADCLV